MAISLLYSLVPHSVLSGERTDNDRPSTNVSVTPRATTAGSNNVSKMPHTWAIVHYMWIDDEACVCVWFWLQRRTGHISDVILSITDNILLHYGMYANDTYYLVFVNTREMHINASHNYICSKIQSSVFNRMLCNVLF